MHKMIARTPANITEINIGDIPPELIGDIHFSLSSR